MAIPPCGIARVKITSYNQHRSAPFFRALVVLQLPSLLGRRSRRRHPISLLNSEGVFVPRRGAAFGVSGAGVVQPLPRHGHELIYFDLIQRAGRSKTLFLLGNVEHSSDYFVYLLMISEKRTLRFQSILTRLKIRT